MERVVDRERACPMLLRTFVCDNQHNDVALYRGLDGTPAGNAGVHELALYVWRDTSLVELAELIRERLEVARSRTATGRGTRGGKPSLHFSLVYPTREGSFVMRPLGTVRGAAKDRPLDAAVQQGDRGAGARSKRSRDGDGREGGGGGALGPTSEETYTLADANFDAGDYLDVAILRRGENEESVKSSRREGVS